MLRRLDAFPQVDGRKLMDIYREGNVENAAYFYPDMEDKVQALERAEREFLHYLETDFFAKPGNVYWVLEEDGVWVSALRLSEIAPGDYYLEALETHPGFRRRGCGAKLLTAVLEELKPQGPFRLRDCVGKKNVPSLGVHEKCGFRIAAQDGLNCLSGEVNDRCYGMEYAWEGAE